MTAPDTAYTKSACIVEDNSHRDAPFESESRLKSNRDILSAPIKASHDDIVLEANVAVSYEGLHVEKNIAIPIAHIEPNFKSSIPTSEGGNRRASPVGRGKSSPMTISSGKGVIKVVEVPVVTTETKAKPNGDDATSGNVNQTPSIHVPALLSVATPETASKRNRPTVSQNTTEMSKDKVLEPVHIPNMQLDLSTALSKDLSEVPAKRSRLEKIIPAMSLVEEEEKGASKPQTNTTQPVKVESVAMASKSYENQTHEEKVSHQKGKAALVKVERNKINISTEKKTSVSELLIKNDEEGNTATDVDKNYAYNEVKKPQACEVEKKQKLFTDSAGWCMVSIRSNEQSRSDVDHRQRETKENFSIAADNEQCLTQPIVEVRRFVLKSTQASNSSMSMSSSSLVCSSSWGEGSKRNVKSFKKNYVRSCQGQSGSDEAMVVSKKPRVTLFSKSSMMVVLPKESEREILVCIQHNITFLAYILFCIHDNKCFLYPSYDKKLKMKSRKPLIKMICSQETSGLKLIIYIYICIYFLIIFLLICLYCIPAKYRR